MYGDALGHRPPLTHRHRLCDRAGQGEQHAGEDADPATGEVTPRLPGSGVIPASCDIVSHVWTPIRRVAPHGHACTTMPCSTLIRKSVFMAQCRQEAGLTEIF